MIDSAMCDYCLYCHTGERGEWQCHHCQAHYWTERVPTGEINTYRVFDVEQTMDQITAQQQAAIVRACRKLERAGYRLCVDFGWSNAVALAVVIEGDCHARVSSCLDGT